MFNELFTRITAGAILAGGLTLSTGTWAQNHEDGSESALVEVTVTNVTRDQRFTPILVASHQAGVRLFDLGEPASSELQIVAEEGDVAPLTAALLTLPGVFDVTNSGALLDPGASATITVKVRGTFNHISLAAMLIPTNDGFFAVNGTRVPSGRNQALVLTSVAYDAGSERNDELCASIPGPSFVECGGPGGGGQPAGGEEGYVHVHAGIHGIGDLDEAQRDWRNPVARVTLKRVQ